MGPEEEQKPEGMSAFDEPIDTNLLEPDQAAGESAAPPAAPDTSEKEAAPVTEDEKAGATSTSEVDDEWKDVPFNKHPRFQQLARERKEARERLRAAEDEKAVILEERERVRAENSRLAYYKQLDDDFRQHPDRFEKARKIYELGQQPEIERAPTDDPVKAELFQVKQDLAQIRQEQRQSRQEQESSARWQGEVSEINRHLVGEKGIDAADHQMLGETIHMKYRANLARGGRVPLEQVAREVIEWRRRDVAAQVEKYKKGKAPNGEPAPSRQGQARVPLSAEADRQRTKVKRLASGRIDPGWADDAAREFDDLTRGSR